MTSIQWTSETWNPVRGCSRVSAGCDQCYAMKQAHRFAGPGQPYEGLTTIRRGKVDWAGSVRFVPGMLGQPLRWKKPRRIFVNSMSDLFHESLSFEDIAAAFGVMAACPQHTFQVLTKRPKRMLEWFEWIEAQDPEAGAHTECHWYALNTELPEADGPVHRKSNNLDDRPWPLPNVHLGVSIEDQKTADERIPLLLQCQAVVRWVSAEPLLGEVDLGAVPLPDAYLRLRGISGVVPRIVEQSAEPDDYRYWRKKQFTLDWVVVGGESGPGARPCNVEWIRSIVRQCKGAGVPCFTKQLGSVWAKYEHPAAAWGRKPKSSKGGDPSEWPEDLRVREFPEAAND